jgi:hypothetical protein
MKKEPNGRAPVERWVRPDCLQIGHWPEFYSASGGYIYWRCLRCGTIEKTEDSPFMSCASGNTAPVIARHREMGDLGSAESMPTNTRPHDA